MSKNRSNAVSKEEAGLNSTNNADSTNGANETVTSTTASETVAPEVQTTAPKADPLAGTAFVGKSAEDLIKEFGNKSNAIRAMSAAGLKAGPISKALGIRYQHARNVLSQPLKRVIKAERDGKSEKSDKAPAAATK